MQVKIETITPAKAEQYLRKNDRNRKLKPRSLQKIKDQMESGEWLDNTGETIKFDNEGNLLDGQHRLQSLIETGLTFDFLVVRGLNGKVFNVIDTGKPRNAGDALHVLGVKNYYNISAIIRNYLYLKIGRVHNKQNDSVATAQKIVETYQESPEMWKEINQKAFYLYIASSKMITQTMIGAWYKHLSQNETEETEVFFQKLCSGIGLTDERDPINVLRNIFISNAVSEKKLTNSVKHAYMVVTWNSYLQGKKYSVIPYRYGKDKFPVLFLTKKEALESIKKTKS
jgi:hypothetical protein